MLNELDDSKQAISDIKGVIEVIKITDKLNYHDVLVALPLYLREQYLGKWCPSNLQEQKKSKTGTIQDLMRFLLICQNQAYSEVLGAMNDLH